jgi:hypothetical protein
MTDSILHEYRWARALLKANRAKIKRSVAEADALRDEEIGIWRELDEAGIARATIAKWSGIDPMQITRALGNKEE